MNKKYLPVVKKLYYRKKMSMKTISVQLGVSLDAVCYFMRKNNLVRRSVVENEAIKFKRKKLSYDLRQALDQSERNLMLAGIMLYWAEGYKTSKSMGIDFANADPFMVEIFVKFLKEICGVDQKRLRVLLYCYSNQSVGRLIDFWSKLTKIPRNQFSKPYVRQDFRKEKLDKMMYGMVHIRYADKKLLAQIMRWIQDFQKKYCVGTQVVNEEGL